MSIQKEERVSERVEQIMDGFTALDDASKMMLDSMVKTFAWYEVSCDDLMERIDREGLLVGDGEMRKENPALAVLHKTAARKQEYFGKIMTVARRAQSDESSEMMDFIADA